jgi:hypothetical protein
MTQNKVEKMNSHTSVYENEFAIKNIPQTATLYSIKH